MFDIFVRFRIEIVIIDAVDNTAQIIRPRAEQAVQPFAVEGRLDLFRICVADRRNRIRINKTAF